MVDIKLTTQLHAEDMQYLCDTKLLESLIKHKVSVRTKSTEATFVDDMKEWLRKNANGKWHYREFAETIYVESDTYNEVYFYFEEEADMVAFKLKFT